MADRRRQRGAPGRDLPRRGVHPAGDDAHARQDRLPPVVHVLHLAQHRRGDRRVPRRRSPASRPPTCARASGPPRTTSSRRTCSTAAPPAFAIRAILAATGAPTWGIYSGYELVENVAAPGRRGADRQREVRVQAAQLVRRAAQTGIARPAHPAQRDPARAPGAPAAARPDRAPRHGRRHGLLLTARRPPSSRPPAAPTRCSWWSTPTRTTPGRARVQLDLDALGLSDGPGPFVGARPALRRDVHLGRRALRAARPLDAVRPRPGGGGAVTRDPAARPGRHRGDARRRAGAGAADDRHGRPGGPDPGDCRRAPSPPRALPTRSSPGLSRRPGLVPHRGVLRGHAALLRRLHGSGLGRPAGPDRPAGLPAVARRGLPVAAAVLPVPAARRRVRHRRLHGRRLAVRHAWATSPSSSRPRTPGACGSSSTW